MPMHGGSGAFHGTAGMQNSLTPFVANAPPFTLLKTADLKQQMGFTGGACQH